MQVKIMIVEIPVCDDMDPSDLLARVQEIAVEYAEEFSESGEVSDHGRSLVENLCSVQETDRSEEIACEDSDEECAA